MHVFHPVMVVILHTIELSTYMKHPNMENLFTSHHPLHLGGMTTEEEDQEEEEDREVEDHLEDGDREVEDRLLEDGDREVEDRHPEEEDREEVDQWDQDHHLNGGYHRRRGRPALLED